MAKFCGWCGQKKELFDMTPGEVDTGYKRHWICGNCTDKIYSVRIRQTSINSITTKNTDPDLLNYFSRRLEKKTWQQNENMTEHEQPTEAVSVEQKNMYENIRQIAGDLRFIKNYLIFTIVTGILLGIIVLIRMI